MHLDRKVCQSTTGAERRIAGNAGLDRPGGVHSANPIIPDVLKVVPPGDGSLFDTYYDALSWLTAAGCN